MSYTNSNRYYKRVKDTYNQNVMSSGIRIPAGIYTGIVVNNQDPNNMGRIKVHIARLYAPIIPSNSEQTIDDSNYLGAVWCRRMIPYGGADNAEGRSSSYGMLGPPPAVDNEVVVAFSGESDMGILLGVLPGEGRMSNIAGIHTAETEEGIGPAYELPRTTSEDDIPKPVHPLFKQLKKQGLHEDRIRGLNFSSVIRDPINRVFAISTPQGHSLVMDDGELEQDSINIIRLRTANGSQILMDDTNGFIYIVNRDGTSWIEMNRTGDMDIYAKQSINFSTEGEFNIHANGGVNIQGNRAINMKTLGEDGIKIFSCGSNVDIKASNNLNLAADANGNISVAGGFRVSSKRIDLNGPAAETAAIPSIFQLNENQIIKESISPRVPEHEPWRGHVDQSQLDTNSPEAAAKSNDDFPGQASFPPGPDVLPNGMVRWAPGVDRRVDPALLDIVQSIASELGKALVLSSGYRDPVRNRRVGGASKSQHLKGKAVDISAAGLNNADRIKMIELASRRGIKGIGVYPGGSMHLDIGDTGPRAWGGDFTSASIPSYAAPALRQHTSGRF